MKVTRKSRSAIIAVLVLTIGITSTVFLSQRRQEVRQHASGKTCNPTGVTKNQDGTFSFAQLQVNPSGILVDQSGCQIYLLGGQGKGIAVKNVKASVWNMNTPDFSYVGQLNQKVPMNVIRVPLFDNSWATNDPVSGSTTLYQDFLKTYVKGIESYGDYVEFDNYFTQASPSATTDITQAVQTLSDLAGYYKSDPAVLFDIRNEGSDGYNPTVIAQNIQLIAAIDKANKNAIKVIYDAGIRDLADGSLNLPFFYANPNGTQPNIIIDEHIYDGEYLTKLDKNNKKIVVCSEPNGKGRGQFYWETILSTFQSTVIPYLHTNHAGLIINESGGHCDYPDYTTALVSFVIQNKIAGLNYFYPLIEWFNGLNPLGYDDGSLTSQAYTSIFGSLGITPTISQTPSLTPTGKITPSITITSTLTPTINPQDSRIALTICPHGLGHCGDNANPKGQGTQAPQHITKTVTLTLLDTHNTQVGQPITTSVSFVPASENFQGIADLGVIPTGDYLLSIKSEGYLGKQLNQIIHLIAGQTTALPEVFLVTGDINNDNQVDIQDYNALINCYGTKQSSQSCLFAPTKQSAGADILDDDGQVDAGDYNEFLRELSVQQGQ